MFPNAVIGVLRGYDPLVNLVLDECDEYLRGRQRHILHLSHAFTLRFVCTDEHLAHLTLPSAFYIPYTNGVLLHGAYFCTSVVPSLHLHMRTCDATDAPLQACHPLFYTWHLHHKYTRKKTCTQTSIRLEDRFFTHSDASRSLVIQLPCTNAALSPTILQTQIHVITLRHPYLVRSL